MTTNTCLEQYRECQRNAWQAFQTSLEDLGGGGIDADPLVNDLERLRLDIRWSEYKAELQVCRIEYHQCNVEMIVTDPSGRTT